MVIKWFLFVIFIHLFFFQLCFAQLDEPAERLCSRRRDRDPKFKMQKQMISSASPGQTAQPLAILGQRLLVPTNRKIQFSLQSK